MKYIIVEKGWEYNDEYNVIHDDDSYKIASKLFNTMEETEVGKKEAVLKLFKNYKGEFNPNNFRFSDFENDRYSNNLEEYFEQKGWEYDEWDITLPSSATEEECFEAYCLWGNDLIQIIKIDE